jgi:hypothetical protein
MDWLTQFSSTLQVIIWSLQACLFSTGGLLTAMLISVAIASVVFFVIVPGWIRMWNGAWNPINATFISFMLAVATFCYSFVAIGTTRLDSYLESLVETARKEASAPFADWRQVGFPQGFNMLDDGVNVCSVLQKQMPEIQAYIILKEPFRSWSASRIAPISVPCENSTTQPESGVRRDDKRFDANFNSAFEATKQHFKKSINGFSNRILECISWILAGCFTLSFLYVATMAYIDINEHRNPL